MGVWVNQHSIAGCPPDELFMNQAYKYVFFWQNVNLLETAHTRLKDLAGPVTRRKQTETALK